MHETSHQHGNHVLLNITRQEHLTNANTSAAIFQCILADIWQTTSKHEYSLHRTRSQNSCAHMSVPGYTLNTPVMTAETKQALTGYCSPPTISSSRNCGYFSSLQSHTGNSYKQLINQKSLYLLIIIINN